MSEMTEAGYFKDMSIVDERLKACENKLDKLETAVKKILQILEEIKWQPLQSHSE